MFLIASPYWLEIKLPTGEYSIYLKQRIVLNPCLPYIWHLCTNQIFWHRIICFCYYKTKFMCIYMEIFKLLMVLFGLIRLLGLYDKQVLKIALYIQIINNSYCWSLVIVWSTRYLSANINVLKWALIKGRLKKKNYNDEYKQWKGLKTNNDKD